MPSFFDTIKTDQSNQSGANIINPDTNPTPPPTPSATDTEKNPVLEFMATERQANSGADMNDDSLNVETSDFRTDSTQNSATTEKQAEPTPETEAEPSTERTSEEQKNFYQASAKFITQMLDLGMSNFLAWWNYNPGHGEDYEAPEREKKVIQEATFDYLSEKQIQLTPGQRLFWAIIVAYMMPFGIGLIERTKRLWQWWKRKRKAKEESEPTTATAPNVRKAQPIEDAQIIQESNQPQPTASPSPTTPAKNMKRCRWSGDMFEAGTGFPKSATTKEGQQYIDQFISRSAYVSFQNQQRKAKPSNNT